MNAVSIDRVSSYVPHERLVVERDYQRMGIDERVAKVYSRLYELPYCPVSFERQIELTMRPCREILHDVADPDLVVAVIYAHTGAVIEGFGASMPSIIARHLGLRRALTLGTCSSNCVSTLAALRIGASLIARSPPGSQVLLVTGETADNPELRSVHNVAVVGDAAAAALLSGSGNRNRLLGFAMHVHRGFSAGIWMDPDGLESARFTENYQTWLHDIIAEAVASAGLTIDDVCWILPHNVNAWTWRRAAARIGIPIEKIYLDNVSRTAHCLGADGLINLDSLSGTGMLRTGDCYLIASVGVGGTFGAAVFRH